MPTHNPIIINGLNYCLLHLEDVLFSTINEKFTIKIIFSSHCYSVSEKYANETHSVIVPDPNGIRFFDVDRYHLSKHLHDILFINFLELRLFATRKNNFVRINTINKENYYIFLRCRYENGIYIVNIESAYQDTIENPPKYDPNDVRKMKTLLKYSRK